MTVLKQKMIEDMQLRGLSARTQDTYAQVVRQLAKHYHKSPDKLDEEDLRQYFLYLNNVKGVSISTFRIALCDSTAKTMGQNSSRLNPPRLADSLI